MVQALLQTPPLLLRSSSSPSYIPPISTSRFVSSRFLCCLLPPFSFTVKIIASQIHVFIAFFFIYTELVEFMYFLAFPFLGSFWFLVLGNKHVAVACMGLLGTC